LCALRAGNRAFSSDATGAICRISPEPPYDQENKSREAFSGFAGLAERTGQNGDSAVSLNTALTAYFFRSCRRNTRSSAAPAFLQSVFIADNAMLSHSFNLALRPFVLLMYHSTLLYRRRSPSSIRRFA